MARAFHVIADIAPAWLSSACLSLVARAAIQRCLRMYVRPSRGRVSDAWLHAHGVENGKHQGG